MFQCYNECFKNFKIKNKIQFVQQSDFFKNTRDGGDGVAPAKQTSSFCVYVHIFYILTQIMPLHIFR